MVGSVLSDLNSRRGLVGNIVMGNKNNDIVIFLRKGIRAHYICPLFYEKLNKFNFMRINGIIDTDGNHIKFILRGQKHRFYSSKKRQPGNFITFCIKRKKNYFIPIKIR